MRRQRPLAVAALTERIARPGCPEQRSASEREACQSAVAAGVVVNRRRKRTATIVRRIGPVVLCPQISGAWEDALSEEVLGVAAARQTDRKEDGLDAEHFQYWCFSTEYRYSTCLELRPRRSAA